MQDGYYTEHIFIQSFPINSEFENNEQQANRIISYVQYLNRGLIPEKENPEKENPEKENPEKGKFKRAIDYIDRFAENFDPALNPGVDINQLYAGSRKKIWYPDRYGQIKQRSLYDIAHSKIQYHPHADDECFGIIGESKLFWKYCVDEKSMENKQVLRTNRKKMFHMQCPECGKHFQAAPRSIFVNKEPCPFCLRNKKKKPENRVFEGTVDEEDPFLREYWSDDNKVSLDEIALTSTKYYKWECPLCGFKFEKKPVFMVKKTPKCPRCKDRGMKELLSFGQIAENDVYLRKVTGIPERTKRKDDGEEDNR